MTETLGTHWIVTTHGTWLHGDPRGSWKDGKLIGPDSFLHELMKERMTADAVILEPADLLIVADSFGKTCAEQGHPVYAATVRHTHAHIVFGRLHEDIKIVIARLKRRSAAEVFRGWRARGRPTPRSLWTEGQFSRFLFSLEHLYSAIEYVRGHNIRAGLAEEPYSWIRCP